MEHNASLRRFINTPLSQVQRWLGHSGAPLFDTILVYQPWEQQLPSSQPWRVIDEKATIDYPLSLEAEESASGSMRFNVVFQPNIIPMEQAELFLSQFDALFTQLLESPEGDAQQVAEQNQRFFSILPADYAELPSKVLTTQSTLIRLVASFLLASGPTRRPLQPLWRQLPHSHLYSHTNRSPTAPSIKSELRRKIAEGPSFDTNLAGWSAAPTCITSGLKVSFKPWRRGIP